MTKTTGILGLNNEFPKTGLEKTETRGAWLLGFCKATQSSPILISFRGPANFANPFHKQACQQYSALVFTPLSISPQQEPTQSVLSYARSDGHQLHRPIKIIAAGTTNVLTMKVS